MIFRVDRRRHLNTYRAGVVRHPGIPCAAREDTGQGRLTALWRGFRRQDDAGCSRGDYDSIRGCLVSVFDR